MSSSLGPDLFRFLQLCGKLRIILKIANLNFQQWHIKILSFLQVCSAVVQLVGC